MPSITERTAYWMAYGADEDEARELAEWELEEANLAPAERTPA